MSRITRVRSKAETKQLQALSAFIRRSPATPWRLGLEFGAFTGVNGTASNGEQGSRGTDLGARAWARPCHSHDTAQCHQRLR